MAFGTADCQRIRHSAFGIRHCPGFTVIEQLFVLAIIAIVIAISIPEMLSGLDEARTRMAARYVAGEMYRTRAQAVMRSTRVACRFLFDGEEYAFGSFADGNANGVRAADIASGVDRRLTADIRLSALFGQVRFAIGPGVPLIDGGAGADPIRISSGSLLTFSPIGSASGGSLYIRGARGAQYAVRVFGVTGRTRVFRYLPGAGWKLQ